MAVLIGIDMGTTHCKVAAFSADGELLHLVRERTPTEQPRPGWAEYDPDRVDAIVSKALQEVTAALSPAHGPVRGVGVAGMAEAGLLIDRKGTPLTRVHAWYDQRAAEYVPAWDRGARSDEVFRTTGTPPSPKCPIIKLQWIKDHQPDVFERAWKWLHLPDYVAFRLTENAYTDLSLATRTLAFDIHRGVWCEWILATAGISAEIFPTPVTGVTPVGIVTQEAAKRTGLPAGIPVVVAGHDHICGAAGVGALDEGAAVDSMGTAESLVAVRDRLPLSQMRKEGFSYGRHVVPGRFYVAGGFSGSGASIEWWMDRLGAPTDESRYPWLLRLLEQAPSGSTGLLYLPYLRGSAPPKKDPAAKAMLFGISERLDEATWMKAIIEGLACEFRRVLDDLPVAQGGAVTAIGGGTSNPYWLQLKADVANRRLLVPAVVEAVAQGAALLAGVAAGVYTSAEEGAAAVMQSERLIDPNPQAAMVYDRWYREMYLPAWTASLDLQKRLRAFS